MRASGSELISKRGWESPNDLRSRWGRRKSCNTVPGMGTLQQCWHLSFNGVARGVLGCASKLQNLHHGNLGPVLGLATAGAAHVAFFGGDRKAGAVNASIKLNADFALRTTGAVALVKVYV